MRKTFTLFSRVMALLFAAVLAMPSWANGNPYPDSYWQAYWGYSEETPVDLEKTFPIGTTFNIMEEFPALAGKALLIDYYSDYDIPASDNEAACVFEVSEPQYQMELGSLYSITLGRGFCVGGGDAHMTVWAFDYEFDPANNRNVFTKKYTYNITVHVSNELQPGYDVNYNEAQEADPSVIHDIKMYVGETRENWIGFFACQVLNYDMTEGTIDVDCGQVYDDNTHSRFPTLTSGDESIVTIGTENYGMPNIHAEAPGEAIITVQSPDPGEYYTAVSKTFKVTVLEGYQEHPGEGGLHFTNLNRHNPDFPLFKAYTGHGFALPTLVNETGLPNSELQFSSTNTNVATIDGNGVITLTGEFGDTRISVEQRYYPKNHSDMFDLAVTDPFTVMGAAVSPSQYDDILNDGGSLKYIPETHTFVMEDLHVDYLNGGQLTESNYDVLHDNASIIQSVPTSFINWNMPDDVNIYLIGSNEILNANRIVLTDTTICHNVTFTGHGSLYAKIYYSSFVNGVYTNAFVQSGNDYREVIAEGDTVTNITIDGASVTVDRDVTYDLHYPNFYSQVISGNKLKVINSGYIHANLVGSIWGISRAKAVISLNELETDATTELYSYLEWDSDPFGYNYDDPTGKKYMSKTFLQQGGWAVEFETGPTITVAATAMNYNFRWEDPGTSDDIMFQNSAAAQFQGGQGVLMYSGYTDAQVEDALKTLGPGTASWYNAIPGALTLYLAEGSGSFTLNSIVNPGYLLKVMIVDGDKTHKLSFTGNGSSQDYIGHYMLGRDSYAAIYLQQAPAGAPARRAPQQKLDAPGIILSGLSADPEYVGPMETVTAKQDPDAAGNYYATFYYSDKNYRLPNDGTEAYYATIDGSGNLQMTLVAENNNVILKDHAVILKATKATIGLIPELDVPTYPVMPEATTAANDLVGVDVETAAPANCYVLSGHSTDNSVTGVGFYQFTGTLVAHKAYAIYSGGASLAPAHRMRFIFNTPTGIDEVQKNNIQSTKVLENGQLIIIKNGVRYNAQGQIVK